MEEQSVQNVGSIARRSLVLGIVSSVLLSGPFLLRIYANRFLPNRDLSTGFGLVLLAVCFFFSSLMVGIIGLIMSLRILWRIKRQGDAHIINRTLIISLVLNGLIVASLLLYLTLGVLFSLGSPQPPPVVISPSPPTP